jgi:Na+-driven multidrug efflux pump
LTLSRQVLVLLPLVIVLPRFWGVNGVWLSFPVADAISFLVTLVFVLAALNKFPDNI